MQTIGHKTVGLTLKRKPCLRLVNVSSLSLAIVALAVVVQIAILT